MVCLAHNSSSNVADNTSKVSSRSKTVKKASNSPCKKDKKRAMVLKEFQALKQLLPEEKDEDMSALDVVLQAISYIRSLEKRLAVDPNVFREKFAQEIRSCHKE